MITAVLILFILGGVAFPALIKNKTQFHVAMAFAMLAILLSPWEFHTLVHFVIAILQFLTFLALILCAGGINFEELAGNMFDAYDAMRHGEERPVIVPRTGETPKEKAESPPVVPTAAPPAPEESSIPLEPSEGSDEKKEI
ncbi:MAG TPA: hypothetical protein VG722_10350 [Tepidisphaeraceae bacterium]|nr:hypothetical protein [Tepidisphaeraceae bacterium]